MRLLNSVSVIAEGRNFAISLALILLLGLFFRVYHISADPPVGFTASQDVNTDPFAYTMFARNLIEFGDTNPFGDPRWVVWEKSIETVFALGVYAILGTGRGEGNFVPVLMYLLATLFLALALKNFGSRFGALLAAFLAMVNFTMIVFARIPFVESALNLWLCASVFFFSLGPKRSIYYLLAGFCAASAGFFGKLTGLFSIGIFAAMWVFMLVRSKERAPVLKTAAFFWGGFVLSAVAWLVYVYLPSSEVVSWYYKEQGTGLYGSPKALESPRDFLFQAQSLLWERRYIEKLPIVTTLAFLGSAGAITLIIRRLYGRKPMRMDAWALMFFWCFFAFAALFPFNYRPLRYQATLLLPMVGLAALFLEAAFVNRIEKKSKPLKESKGGLAVRIALTSGLTGILLIPLFSSLFLVMGTSETPLELYQSIFLYSLLFIAPGAGIWLLAYFGRKAAEALKPFAQILVAVLIVVYSVIHIADFAGWMSERRYTLMAADHDLGAIVGENAVVSGSYGTALTRENGLRSIHHHFGTTTDPGFFEEFPVTHLAVDPSNEKIARQEYPDLMGRALQLNRYVIRGYPVKLFLVSMSSPSPQAGAYSLTDFEVSRLWEANGDTDSAAYYMQSFVEKNTGSYSAHAALAMQLSEVDAVKSLDHFRKAFELSYESPALSYAVGVAYFNLAVQNESFLDSALVYLEHAYERMPNNSDLEKIVTDLRNLK